MQNRSRTEAEQKQNFLLPQSGVCDILASGGAQAQRQPAGTQNRTNQEVGWLSVVYLILENGTVFKGQSFGYTGEAVGKLVFSTSMTGYMETLADPAYEGQIVLQTFPLIGNYGVISDEFGEGPTHEGPIHLKAYIVRQWCQEPSNFRSEGTLDTFLKEKKIPGLCEIDTRALMRIIRENGPMNAMLSTTAELNDEQWAALRGCRA